MATHSSILAWKIPWTEECGRLQSMGSQRVGHDQVTSLSFMLGKYCSVWRHFGCHSYGDATDIQWVEVRDAVERLKIPRTSPPQPPPQKKKIIWYQMRNRFAYSAYVF